MQAFIQLLGDRKINVSPLVTHRFPITDATKAYELIAGSGGEAFLGVVLTYSETPDLSRKIVIRSARGAASEWIIDSNRDGSLDQLRLGMIGAGLYANATLLPAIKEIKEIDLIGVASRSGLSARAAADRYGFDYCTTDEQAILTDPAINAVALLTRHHLHARQVIAALKAGKHVFVEKPLCLSEEELQEIIATYNAVTHDHHTQSVRTSFPSLHPPSITVGFNRRFAPYVVELKRHLQTVQEPLVLNYRINAGYVPSDHWTQDLEQGGGRLLGEGCHYIDLLIYLAGSEPNKVTARALPDSGRYSTDNLVVSFEFANGSLGTMTYVANGDKRFSKECIEVFGGGLSASLEDYRSLLIQHGQTRVKRHARLRQDKGHRAEWLALVACLTGKGLQPMTFADIVVSTRATLAAHHSLQSGAAVSLHEQSHTEVEPHMNVPLQLSPK